MKTIEVKYCTDCPFGSWSTGGTNSINNRRLHLHCNLQEDSGNKWNAKRKYSCFKTCPLKTGNVKVVMKQIGI